MENYQAAGEQSHSSPPTTRYRGVRLRKWGSWVAEVRLPNSRERLWLGSYATAEQAARAFDAAVYCLRGPCATFNFPDEPPNIPNADTLSKEEIRASAARFALEGRRANGEEKRQAAGSPEVRKQEEVPVVEYSDLPTTAGGGADWWDSEEDAEGWNGSAVASDDIYRMSPLWNF